jgi:hypothetical protein
LEPKVLEQIERSLSSYNEAEGKTFRVLRRSGPPEAKKLIDAAMKLYQREKPEER